MTATNRNLAGDFHVRLAQACEDSRIIPEYGHGRQVVISKKLKVSQEAVRKWFAGDTRPRVNKMRELAQLLDVDEAWLALGIEPEMARSEKRAHNQRSDGAIYLMFGALTMAGGHCAFPSNNDPRKDLIDFYAIYRGAQYALHVANAREVTKNAYEFIIPREWDLVHCVGVVHMGVFNFHLLDFPSPLLETHAEKKGGHYVVRLSKRDGHYFSGADEWPRLHSIEDIK